MKENGVSLYRPEIDGLRVIAVLFILFFHAGFSWAAGGFTGVDIFFVISGFLITENILNDIEKGRFSAKVFFLRRFRRLFPALLFILFLCYFFSFILFSSTNLQQFSKSLISALFSISNILFWQEQGYFDSSLDFKPLLHTWSLSIEGQYYLVWPVLLIVLTKMDKKYLPFILAFIGLISLAISELALDHYASASFYLLPFRIFEFIIGSMCVWLTKIKPKGFIIPEVATISGIGLIISSLILLNEASPFPGVRALLPCFGAFLLIYGAGESKAGTILRSRCMRGIGLISYSVYLIHWPLFVFYKYWRFSPLSIIEKSCLIFGSIILGYLMWRFVETPFRYKKESDKVTSRFTALIFSLSVLTVANGGWPGRFPPKRQITQDQMLEERSRYWNDLIYNKHKELDGDNGARKILVLGSSHAIDLIYALRENGSRANFTLLISDHHCFNFGTAIKSEHAEKCRAGRAENFSRMAAIKVDAIYLHDHWPAKDFVDLFKTLKEIGTINSAPIYVFGPKMAFTQNIPDIVHTHRESQSLNRLAKKYMNRDVILLNSELEQVMKNSGMENVYFVNILKSQCGANTDRCEIVSRRDQAYLYIDTWHFTRQGAKEFGARLKNDYPEVF